MSAIVRKGRIFLSRSRTSRVAALPNLAQLLAGEPWVVRWHDGTACVYRTIITPHHSEPRGRRLCQNVRRRLTHRTVAQHGQEIPCQRRGRAPTPGARPQLYIRLRQLGYHGSYDWVTAFARRWRQAAGGCAQRRAQSVCSSGVRPG